MQIKTIMGYHYTPTRVAKVKRLTICSADEDLEQLEPPYSTGRNIKWYTTLGNSCKHTPAIPLLFTQEK